MFGKPIRFRKKIHVRKKKKLKVQDNGTLRRGDGNFPFVKWGDILLSFITYLDIFSLRKCRPSG
jgi:hypothetical protein